jgi:hypothetical protein
MASVIVPGFLASTHGFPFPNSYPANSPVIEFPTPWGPVPIGDAQYGLCGGMVYASLDFYLFSISRPMEPTKPVFKYFCRRLLESWNFPFGVLKYFDWQCRPSASKFVSSVRVLPGVSSLMILEEWPRIRAELDRGMPVPLGLVKPYSFNPKDLNKNHQVLAYGYSFDEATSAVELRVYDPNFPNDDTTTLRFDLNEPDSSRHVTHSCEGPTVRGIFCPEYRKPTTMPELLVAEIRVGK